MKIQIHKGVFETNSSSIHSLTLDSQHLSNIAEGILNYCEIPLKMEDFSKENSFILRGVYIHRSDELSSCINIINIPLAKIQYLALLLFSNRYYFEDFIINHDHNTEYSPDNKYYSENIVFKTTRIAKTFTKFVREVLNLDDNCSIIWDVDFELVVDDFDEYVFNIFEKVPLDENDILKFIEQSLKPSTIIISKDIAYSSIEPTKIILR